MPHFSVRMLFVARVFTLAALAFALSAAAAPAATLHPGDVVVLAREYTYTPGILIHVNVPSGVIDTILPSPPLVTPRDLVVRLDGTILVADASLGLVGVDPLSGAAQVVAGPAAFGGFGPTTLALAPNHDVLLAGPGGVARLADGQTLPQVLSGAGVLVDPTGITDDGSGGAWVTDAQTGTLLSGQIVHVGAGGSQSVLAPTCATHTFPILPMQIRRGPDMALYVVNAPYSGPTNWANGGIFRLDPATGVATLWEWLHFIRGFEFAANGSRWVLYGQSISHDAYGGVVEGPSAWTYTGARGPIALVPDVATPVHQKSWGALKSLYR
jgi:hypothetical protein